MAAVEQAPRRKAWPFSPGDRNWARTMAEYLRNIGVLAKAGLGNEGCYKRKYRSNTCDPREDTE
jgi:hypothetical protein